MKSFRDPGTGVLRAWGQVESNGIDLVRDEPDEFNLEPGKWRLMNGAWIAHNHVAVPQSVSMRQGREALIRRGYFDVVDSHIAAMPGVEGMIARNEWNKSQVIERMRPLTLEMGQLLGLGATEMDELFIFAATL